MAYDTDPERWEASSSRLWYAISWLNTLGVDADPLGGTSLRNEGRAAENCKETEECRIEPASFSGDHAHRWGSGRATQILLGDEQPLNQRKNRLISRGASPRPLEYNRRLLVLPFFPLRSL